MKISLRLRFAVRFPTPISSSSQILVLIKYRSKSVFIISASKTLFFSWGKVFCQLFAGGEIVGATQHFLTTLKNKWGKTISGYVGSHLRKKKEKREAGPERNVWGAKQNFSGVKCNKIDLLSPSYSIINFLWGRVGLCLASCPTLLASGEVYYSRVLAVSKVVR